MRSRILLADDSITIQKVVNLTFADEGIDVVAVSNGEMAEKRLSEVNPDLVLADIFMPGKNGYELCETIKKSSQYRNVPVVLLVGAFEPFDQGEARRVRADGHLTKPFESRTLVETVRKLIGSSTKRSGPLTAPAPPAVETPEPRVDPLDTNPMTPPPALAAEQLSPEIPIEVAMPLSETSPLDIDYSVSQSAPAEAMLNVTPSSVEDVIEHYEGSFVITTGPLSSEGPKGAAHSDNGQNGGGPVREVSSEQQVLDEATPMAVAPPVSGAAGDLMLDFDVHVEPEPSMPIEVSQPTAAESSEVSGDVQQPRLSDSVPAASPEMDSPAAVQPELTSAEPLGDLLGDEPSSQYHAELSADQPLDAEPLSVPEAILAEPVVQAGHEAADATPVPQSVPEPYHAEPALQVAEEPVLEAMTTNPPTNPLDEAGQSAPVASTSEAVPEVAVVVQEAQVDVLMPPPVVPADFSATNLDWDQPVAVSEPVSAQATESAAEAITSPLEEEVAEPAAPPADDRFKSSAMWSDEETRFTPIDIEATPVNETEEPRLQSTSVVEPEPVPASTSSDALSEPAPAPVASTTSEAPAAMESEAPSAEPQFEQAPVLSDVSVSPEPAATETATGSSSVPTEMIDEIVRRVVKELSESVVREIAWEVVPDCVERVVSQVTREEVGKRA